MTFTQLIRVSVVLALLGLQLRVVAADSIAANPVALKYGLMMQFGLGTFAPPGEAGSPEHFAPTAVDAKNWARTAKDAGMTFAVLLVKQHSGFCLWETKGYGYDLSRSPVKIDIIAEYVRACTAEGIYPGVWYAIRDVRNDKGSPTSAIGPEYFELVKKHITELHTKYPGIRVQIFGESQKLSKAQFTELADLVRKLNPSCEILEFFDGTRNIGRPVGFRPVNKDWIWTPKSESNLESAEECYKQYTQHVGSGHAFMLNVGINREGRVPTAFAEVLNRVSGLIKRGTDNAAPNIGGTKKTAAERLKEIKDLFEKGLITKEASDQKTKEILDSL